LGNSYLGVFIFPAANMFFYIGKLNRRSRLAAMQKPHGSSAFGCGVSASKVWFGLACILCVGGGAIQARLKAARATRLFGPIFATAGLVAMTKARPRQAEICSRKIAAVIEIIR
jgi:hypothetical protein